MDIDWGTVYKRCFQAVADNSIHDLVQVGYDFLQLPINIEDANLTLLAMLPEETQND